MHKPDITVEDMCTPEEMRQILRESDRYRGLSQWISVSDCLPDDDVQVIIAFNYCGRVIVSTDYYDHDYDEWLGHEYNDVTHWMPLPDPPNV